MNHHSAFAVLDLHREGRLSPRRTAAVEAHLASCAECRAAAAPAPSAPAAPAPAALKDRLRGALSSARPGPEPAAPALTALFPSEASGVAWAAAAVALVALCVGWSGVPTQQFDGGDELAAGRIP